MSPLCLNNKKVLQTKKSTTLLGPIREGKAHRASHCPPRLEIDKYRDLRLTEADSHKLKSLQQPALGRKT